MNERGISSVREPGGTMDADEAILVMARALCSVLGHAEGCQTEPCSSSTRRAPDLLAALLSQHIEKGPVAYLAAEARQVGWLGPYGLVPGGLDNDPTPSYRPVYVLRPDESPKGGA